MPIFLEFVARGQLAFPIALVLFALCYVGLGISIFPYTVPGKLSIWDTAAPGSSLLFMLVGTIFVLPLIIACTSWAYYVFRGKTVAEGYHQ
jgi:cytochrome d ubiquinol oxidase subunit II